METDLCTVHVVCVCRTRFNRRAPGGSEWEIERTRKALRRIFEAQDVDEAIAAFEDAAPHLDAMRRDFLEEGEIDDDEGVALVVAEEQRFAADDSFAGFRGCLRRADSSPEGPIAIVLKSHEEAAEALWAEHGEGWYMVEAPYGEPQHDPIWHESMGELLETARWAGQKDYRDFYCRYMNCDAYTLRWCGDGDGPDFDLQ